MASNLGPEVSSNMLKIPSLTTTFTLSEELFQGQTCLRYDGPI